MRKESDSPRRLATELELVLPGSRAMVIEVSIKQVPQ